MAIGEEGRKKGSGQNVFLEERQDTDNCTFILFQLLLSTLEMSYHRPIFFTVRCRDLNTPTNFKEN